MINFLSLDGQTTLEIPYRIGRRTPITNTGFEFIDQADNTVKVIKLHSEYDQHALQFSMLDKTDFEALKAFFLVNPIFQSDIVDGSYHTYSLTDPTIDSEELYTLWVNFTLQIREVDNE